MAANPNPLFTRSEKSRVRKKIRHKIKGAARRGLASLFGIPLSRGLGGSSSRPPARRVPPGQHSSSAVRGDVISSLLNLGYKKRQAESMVPREQSGESFDSLFRRATQRNPGELIIFGNPAQVYSRKKILAAQRAGNPIPAAILQGLQFALGEKAVSSLPQRKHRRPRRNARLVDVIRPGDRVTIVNRFGQEHTGRAVMRSSTGGWVLNMGGKYGTPGLADDDNITRVKPSKAKHGGNPRPGDYDKPQTRRDIARYVKQTPKGQRKAALHSLEGYVRPPKRSTKFMDRFGKEHDDPNVLLAGYGRPAKTPRRKKGKVLEMPRRNRKRHNPGSVDRAEKLFETFHHRDAGGVYETQRSAKARKTYTILGPLVAIGINGLRYDQEKRVRGKKQWEEYKVEHWDKLPHLGFLTTGQISQVKRILEEPDKYVKDCPQLASSPGGNQLYAITPDGVEIDLRQFDTDTSKDFVDMGEATFVVYIAKKPDNPVEWIHELGEDGGARPRLVLNRLGNKELFFVGGTYRVEGPGILN